MIGKVPVFIVFCTVTGWIVACAAFDPNSSGGDHDASPDTEESSNTDDTEDPQHDTESNETESEHALTGCGDGNLEGDEQCDDGNRDSGDGCSPMCTVEHCGDGQLNPSSMEAHVEDFETGTLPADVWLQGNKYGFELTSRHVHGGAYSIQPTNGGISSSVARISIEAYTDGTICFWFFGRSSNNFFFSDYDYLYFYIDDEHQNSWLGVHTTWEEYCAHPDPGWKKFTWEYKKDASGSSVIDSYFIDDIRFAAAYKEECDDGNNLSGDGCSATCLKE